MDEIDSPKSAICYLLQTRGRRHQDVPPHKREEVKAQMDVLCVAATRLNLRYETVALDFAPRKLERLDQLPKLQKLVESHRDGDPPIVVADAFDLLARFREAEQLAIAAALVPCVIDGKSETPLRAMKPHDFRSKFLDAANQKVFLRRRARESAKTRKQRNNTNIVSDSARKAATESRKQAAFTHAEPIYKLYMDMCRDADCDHVPYTRLAERANELGLTTSRGNPYDAAKARDAVLRYKRG